MKPEIHVIQDWPAAMRKSLAAQYLDVCPSQFDRFIKLYPAWLKPFNLINKGDARWSRADLDKFIEFRASQGLEAV